MSLVFKYCPFCGEKIIMTENANENSQSNTPPFVQEKLKVEQLSPQEDEYAEIHTDLYKQKKLQNFIETECYSIILKNAPNKQDLVRKLDKVLLRGSFAIRLAVDTVPSIIVYKAKSEDMAYLQEVFLSEQASTSIVVGDFNNKPAIEDIFTMFDTLHIQIQKTIQ